MQSTDVESLKRRLVADDLTVIDELIRIGKRRGDNEVLNYLHRYLSRRCVTVQGLLYEFSYRVGRYEIVARSDKAIRFLLPKVRDGDLEAAKQCLTLLDFYNDGSAAATAYTVLYEHLDYASEKKAEVKALLSMHVRPYYDI